MDVVLVGPPGSGKSAVGRRVARASGAAFVDLDDAIEQAAGTSVARIFETEGEAGFRARERAAIEGLGTADPASRTTRVVAAGGGAVVDPRNRWRLYRGRRAFHLTAAPEVVAGRLATSRTVRPLIAGREPTSAVRDLLAARTRFYDAAEPVEGSGRVDDVAGRLADAIARPAPDGTRLLTAATAVGRIDIGAGHAARATAAAIASLGARRATLASEREAWDRHGERIAGDLGADGTIEVQPLLLPRGEEAKSMTAYEAALRHLAGRRMERGEPIVACGGGALGDAAGFIAATWLRGVPLVQLPTTLLAQVDSAIGGKVGLNLPEGKNLVGAFHQPATIVLDIELLATLPARELRAALGECVKYAVLGDDRIFELLESDGPAIAVGAASAFESGAVAELVERCAWAKVEVVTADEREQALRMHLNLGHSIAHGIEAAAGYRDVLHGEAVARGLLGALEVGRALGVTPDALIDRTTALVERLGLAVGPLPYTADRVAAGLGVDKKVAGGRLRWVLRSDDGIVIRTDVPDAVVETGILVALAGIEGRAAA
jgi:shikimate kinase / 3-dehydroquinate synthase